MSRLFARCIIIEDEEKPDISATVKHPNKILKALESALDQFTLINSPSEKLGALLVFDLTLSDILGEKREAGTSWGNTSRC